ncbi:MAG TPA: VOC family protein [Mycobacteriales bacterium]|nr:VOC family protein [Mycobacteriales bacterium]
MTALARLGGISLDSSDPDQLARFYQDFLELERVWDTPDFVALSGAGIYLTTFRIDDHRPPDWPTGDVPKQMHLELAVKELEPAEQKALALGARKAATQPAPDRFRVLIDPAGHPFCLTTMIPD